MEEVREFVKWLAEEVGLRRELIWRDSRKSHVRVKVGDPEVRGKVEKIKAEAVRRFGGRAKFESYVVRDSLAAGADKIESVIVKIER